MAIVIPDGILEAPTREYFRIDMLHHVDIEAIISLPKFAFAPYTKEKTYVLIMRRKQKEFEGKLQKNSIWHYIIDFDGFANSDKRFETRLQNKDGQYLHYDLPHLEECFFKGKLETRTNLKGKEIYKSKMVSMDEVNSTNYHNLLSEFYLRPIDPDKITMKEFEANFKSILSTLKQLGE
jgi:hypothetical protein